MSINDRTSGPASHVFAPIYYVKFRVFTFPRRIFFFLVSVSFPGILSLFTSGEQGTGPDQNSASNYMKDKILPFSEGLQLLG